MTKNKETKHHIYHKHKREMEKTALANWIIYTLIWYAFYNLRPGNTVGLFLKPHSLYRVIESKTISLVKIHSITIQPHHQRGAKCQVKQNPTVSGCVGSNVPLDT